MGVGVGVGTGGGGVGEGVGVGTGGGGVGEGTGGLEGLDGVIPKRENMPEIRFLKNWRISIRTSWITFSFDASVVILAATPSQREKNTALHFALRV